MYTSYKAACSLLGRSAVAVALVCLTSLPTAGLVFASPGDSPCTPGSDATACTSPALIEPARSPRQMTLPPAPAIQAPVAPAPAPAAPAPAPVQVSAPTVQAPPVQTAPVVPAPAIQAPVAPAPAPAAPAPAPEPVQVAIPTPVAVAPQQPVVPPVVQQSAPAQEAPVEQAPRQRKLPRLIPSAQPAPAAANDAPAITPPAPSAQPSSAPAPMPSASQQEVTQPQVTAVQQDTSSNVDTPRTRSQTNPNPVVSTTANTPVPQVAPSVDTAPSVPSQGGESRRRRQENTEPSVSPPQVKNDMPSTEQSPYPSVGKQPRRQDEDPWGSQDVRNVSPVETPAPNDRPNNADKLPESEHSDPPPSWRNNDPEPVVPEQRGKNNWHGRDRHNDQKPDELPPPAVDTDWQHGEWGKKQHNGRGDHRPPPDSNIHVDHRDDGQVVIINNVVNSVVTAIGTNFATGQVVSFPVPYGQPFAPVGNWCGGVGGGWNFSFGVQTPLAALSFGGGTSFNVGSNCGWMSPYAGGYGGGYYGGVGGYGGGYDSGYYGGYAAPPLWVDNTAYNFGGAYIPQGSNCYYVPEQNLYYYGYQTTVPDYPEPVFVPTGYTQSPVTEPVYPGVPEGIFYGTGKTNWSLLWGSLVLTVLIGSVGAVYYHQQRMHNDQRELVPTG